MQPSRVAKLEMVHKTLQKSFLSDISCVIMKERFCKQRMGRKLSGKFTNRRRGMIDLGNGWYKGDDGYLHSKRHDEHMRQYWEEILASGKYPYFESQETKDYVEKTLGREIDLPIKVPGEPPKQIREFGGYNWRVLDEREGKEFLISGYVLEHRAYHGVWHENMTKEDMEALSTTWADCDLRAYLNGEFLNSFSESDRARIAETHNQNQNNQWYFADAMASEDERWIRYAPIGGADTIDKIFLLSIDEVVKYFGDSGSLEKRRNLCKETIEDWFDDERLARCPSPCPYGKKPIRWPSEKPVHEEYCKSTIWLLRSPGLTSFRVAHVYELGKIYMAGDAVTGREIPCRFGVRPALWLKV
jgi:hypothetical protein